MLFIIFICFLAISFNFSTTKTFEPFQSILSNFFELTVLPLEIFKENSLAHYFSTCSYDTPENIVLMFCRGINSLNAKVAIIETSQLICKASQLNGTCMMAAVAFNELKWNIGTKWAKETFEMD